MGISASRRVKTTLTKSPEFNSACKLAYGHCLSLTQHGFQGVFPYQLPTASEQIHSSLTQPTKTAHQPYPIILKWVPHPPTRSQIDSALSFVLRNKKPKEGVEAEEMVLLDGPQFEEWALVLYAEAVAGNAGKAVLARVPIGAAGIVGVGALTKSGKGLVGTVVGVYALGVATSIYLGLSS